MCVCTMNIKCAVVSWEGRESSAPQECKKKQVDGELLSTMEKKEKNEHEEEEQIT